MPGEANVPLSQPLFHEPVFSEGVSSLDQSGFSKPHPSDKELYKQIQNLLKKDVVSFDQSRAADQDVFKLQDAFGAHGTQIVQGIQNAGKIIFHALGDSGASNAGKYKNEIHVADQLTMDCQNADAATGLCSCFISAMSSTTSENRGITSINSTSRFETTPHRSSPSPATTTLSSSRIRPRTRRP